jgi:hypothetical protein
VSTIEDFDSEFLFKLLDLHGEGWLGDKARFGGGSEVTMLSDGHDVSELSQSHGPLLRHDPRSDQLKKGIGGEPKKGAFEAFGAVLAGAGDEM